MIINVMQCEGSLAKNVILSCLYLSLLMPLTSLLLPPPHAPYNVISSCLYLLPPPHAPYITLAPSSPCPLHHSCSLLPMPLTM